MATLCDNLLSRHLPVEIVGIVERIWKSDPATRARLALVCKAFRKAYDPDPETVLRWIISRDAMLLLKVFDRFFRDSSPATISLYMCPNFATGVEIKVSSGVPSNGNPVCNIEIHDMESRRLMGGYTWVHDRFANYRELNDWLHSTTCFLAERKRLTPRPPWLLRCKYIDPITLRLSSRRRHKKQWDAVIEVVCKTIKHPPSYGVWAARFTVQSSYHPTHTNHSNL